VTGEYLAARRDAAVVTGQHELLWVRGPDAVGFLDGIVSRHVAGLEAGDVARSLLLQPQGKLQSLLWLLRGAGEVGLVADAGTGEATAAALERFRLRVDAAIEHDLRPLVEVWGPRGAEILSAAGVDAPGGWHDGDGVLAASLPLGSLRRYLVAGCEPESLQAAGARRAGSVAATSVRIEAGEPQMGVDVDESTIPQEAGLVTEAVSLDKGCFLGQELVARIDGRGRVNRHLRGVVITENVLPPAGAAVVAGEDEVGTLTSLGESLALRAPVGLALLRREVAPGDRVQVRWQGGGTHAVVRGLPLDDFAEEAGSPGS
jgi:folate-binding protein YgfZ